MDDEITEKLFPGAPEFDVEENEDGSATVREVAEEGDENSSHYDNLAEDMPSTRRREIASAMMELIEEDKKAREERDKQYADGLKRTGASNPAPGGADFEGASKATHPLLLEACIDFHASAYKEIQPADGPCKTKIVGEYDAKELDRADRICSYMNWQMTEEIAEYEDVLDETLSQVPLSGSQYMKWWWDKVRHRPRCEFFPSDKVYIPLAESSFYESRRVTLALSLTKGEYAARVRDGMYIDLGVYAAPMEPEETKAEHAARRIEGSSQTGFNIDDVRECFELYIEWDLEDGDGPAPYIVTIDKDSDEVIGIRRNWEEGDEEKKKMDWVIEWPFIRWRGVMSLGLVHIIGGLSVAATGTLRALLDSGFVNTVPGGVMLKGVGNLNAQSISVSPGSFAKIDAPPGVDDIRKTAMPFPFNPPSPVLFELLGFLTNAGKGVVSTAEERIAEVNSQMPVGTTMAMMEQGGKVFSAVHKRLHRACKRTLGVVYRLNRMYLTKKRVIEDLGKMVVSPEDFQGKNVIIPVSDPNIFCEGQRLAQMQTVMQLAAGQPGAYDMRKVNERWMRLLRVPDGEDLLTKVPEPKDTNPVAENMGMALGQPAAAFPLQDHFAHIQAHVTFLNDPAFGQNPLIAPTLVPLMSEHLKQHLVMAYAKMMYEAGSEAMGQPLESVMKEQDEHVRAEFDKLMAVIGVKVAKESGPAFQQLLPIFQNLAQLQQQYKPPMPMDPSAVAMADVQRQSQKDAKDAELKQAELQQRGQNSVASLQDKREERMAKMQDSQRKDREKARAAALQEQMKREQQGQDLAFKARVEQRKLEESRRKTMMDAETKRQEQIAEDRRTQAKIAADMDMNEQDNETALAIAKARAADRNDKVGGLKTGSSVTDPNP